ncbi:MAG: T9SS type A sorting domain-containing protein [Ignavibacteria bacterium]|nr:T9SS type A sorting domain-containing protein [Ignavibacteria bacterium]
MKRMLLFLLLIIIVSINGYGQSFVFYRISPPIVQGDTSSINPTVTKGILKNTSSTPLSFKYVRVLNNLPPTWTSQLCAGGYCFAPEIDTLPPYPFPPITLQPNQIDTMTIDVMGLVAGTGTIVIKAYLYSNPSNFQKDTFRVQLNYPSLVKYKNEIVENYSLKQNYPNPFNPLTLIEFTIPENQTVSLIVYDILGNEVIRLIDNQNLKAGKYSVDFNAANLNLSSGMYFYSIITEKFRDSKKMVLTK